MNQYTKRAVMNLTSINNNSQPETLIESNSTIWFSNQKIKDTKHIREQNQPQFPQVKQMTALTHHLPFIDLFSGFK